MFKIKQTIQAHTEHGEGPVWDNRSNELYWVDILQGRIQKAALSDNYTSIQTLNVGEPVGMVGLCSVSNQLIAALKSQVVLLNTTSNDKSIVSSATHEISNTRFNDGKVGPNGKLYAGTMGDGVEPVGNFYFFDNQNNVALLEKSLQVSNGLDWSLDYRTLFLTDSPKKLIYAYDFDQKTGLISNRRIHINASSEVGEPDGLCIDSEGCIWSAQWGGAKVIRYDPFGKKMYEVALPVLYPTSCCFGGANMTELFVTSSKLILSKQQEKHYPLSGNIFILETDTIGLAPHFFSIAE